MTIRTLIADDEPPARDKIRALLAEATDVQIVAETGNGEDTLAAIRQLKPDLLFLDVRMPPPDGVTILQKLEHEWKPCTIFTTAHDEHALDAFSLRVVDYLLKPYTQARFQTALQRAREQIALARARPTSLRRLLARNGERYVVVPVQEIRLIEAASNYVVLHMSNERVVMRRTLGSLEAELDPSQFVRVSRSAIVNLDFVRSIEWVSHGEHAVRLEGGATATLTRGLRELQARLERGVATTTEPAGDL